MSKGIVSFVIAGLTLCLALMLPAPTLAATSYTNSHDHFRVSYPSGWSAVAQSPDSTFSPGGATIRQLKSKGMTYKAVVRWLTGSRSWSAADRAALKKGWDSFVGQYIKDFKSTHALRLVSQKKYTLPGLTATQVIFRKKLNHSDTAETQWRVVLLTKGRTYVYAIITQWTWPKGKAAAEPYQKEWQALVQSFRRLQPLPSLRWFQSHPSDQFLVDMDVVATGHPFKGQRALAPHAGAHIHFGDDYLTWPRNGTAPSNYPPIYAVADGFIDRVDTSLNVGTNDRYGVDLSVARDGSITWDVDYSIEPMIPEPSPGFYRPFITVKKGDHVTKGQIIAYMYLPMSANGTHIHFQLTRSDRNGFFAPAIFTPAVVQAFHDRWGEFGIDGGVTAISACMGWKLAAEENPFGTGAVDCL